MRILHCTVTSTVAAFFLPTTITATPNPGPSKPVPECAQPPRSVVTLPYNFSIDVVAPDLDALPINLENYGLFSAVYVDRPLLDQGNEVGSPFRLTQNKLFNAINPEVEGGLIPDYYSISYQGLQTLAFNSGLASGTKLGFAAVKVCTPNAGTELQLRGYIGKSEF